MILENRNRSTTNKTTAKEEQRNKKKEEKAGADRKKTMEVVQPRRDKRQKTQTHQKQTNKLGHEKNAC